MTTAWVLPGGAAMGSIQAGQISALLAHGIQPDLLIGASAGAVNAAVMAADPTPRGAAHLRDLWSITSRRQVFPLSPTTAVLGVLGRRNHLVPNRAMERWLEQCMPYRQIEEARLPLTITTTDLHSGEPVFFDRGALIPALLASCAMPGVFPPVPIGDRVLVDGGLVADAPIGRAVAIGATRVYVLPTLASGGAQVPKGAAHLLLRALGTTFGATRTREMAAWANDCDIYVVPVPSPATISPFSFRGTAALMDDAATLTAAWLDSLPLPMAASRVDLRQGSVATDRSPAE